MEEGMITSIEPGIYRPGKWGIRIETLVMNQAAGKTEFGDFLSFETLTLCPIDTRCIDLSLLCEDERVWLNAYRETVRACVSPLVEGEAKAWLEKRTQAIDSQHNEQQAMTIKAVVLDDFGGVLIDRDREYLYKQLIPDETECRWFLDNVCKMDWAVQQDGGQIIEDGTDELIALYPDHEALIRAFYARWPEMVSGVLEEGVALVDRLKQVDMPLFGLTNCSAETFPYAWERFHLLRQFREVIVSGRVGVVKPDRKSSR